MRARSTAVVILAALCALGCQQVGEGSSSMSEHNKQLAHRFWGEVVNEGKFDVLDEIVDAEYIQHQKDVAPGRDGLRAFQVAARAAFPDQRATVEDLRVDGDRVITRTLIRATHTGRFGKLEPTGKSVAIAVIDIWRVENGRFKEHWGILDNLDFLRQLGVLPPASK